MSRYLILVSLFSSIPLIQGCGLKEDSLLCTGRQEVQTENENSPRMKQEAVTRTFGFYFIGDRILIDDTTFDANKVSNQNHVIRGVRTEPYSEFSLQKDIGLLRYKTTFSDGKITRRTDFEGHCYRPKQLF